MKTGTDKTTSLKLGTHPMESPIRIINPRQPCKAQNCTRNARTAGYCPRHYQQIRRHGRLTPEREYQHRGDHCQAAGCQQPEVARGFCFRHYQQVRRYGRLTPERERIYGRKSCGVPGCNANHAARGYCKRHYMTDYYLPQRLESVSNPPLVQRVQASQA